MLSHSDIQSLANLLNDGRPGDSSSEEELEQTARAGKDVNEKMKSSKILVRYGERDEANRINATRSESDPGAIWSLDEVPPDSLRVLSEDRLWDPRPVPHYELHYKQAVSTQDIYLQMSTKSPASSSCEILCIVLSLEGESKDSIEVDLSRCSLDLRSRKYRLDLPLPHPCQPQGSTAEWDPVKETLTLNILLQRELDFVNF